MFVNGSRFVKFVAKTEYFWKCIMKIFLKTMLLLAKNNEICMTFCINCGKRKSEFFHCFIIGYIFYSAFPPFFSPYSSTGGIPAEGPSSVNLLIRHPFCPSNRISFFFGEGGRGRILKFFPKNLQEVVSVIIIFLVEWLFKLCQVSTLNRFKTALALHPFSLSSLSLKEQSHEIRLA